MPPLDPGEVQMCTVDDLLGPLAEPCLRMARWEWQPGPDSHPVYLCNFHAEPLMGAPMTPPVSYPTHRYAGSSKQRQGVGLPGHCERCAELGHVKAHRNLGCGDVGCTKAHGDEGEAASRVTA